MKTSHLLVLGAAALAVSTLSKRESAAAPLSPAPSPAPTTPTPTEPMLVTTFTNPLVVVAAPQPVVAPTVDKSYLLPIGDTTGWRPPRTAEEIQERLYLDLTNKGWSPTQIANYPWAGVDLEKFYTRTLHMTSPLTGKGAEW